MKDPGAEFNSDNAWALLTIMVEGSQDLAVRDP